MVSEKIKENLPKITIFCRFGPKRYSFDVFHDFFRNYNLLGAKVFSLHPVHQDASFELSNTIFGQFFQFFIMRGIGGDQKLPNVEKKVKKDSEKNS